jgi:hypothetical protein
MTQNNLGNALRRLGEREGSTARLEEAVAAYRAALQVFQGSGASHDMAQHNLRMALALLNERRQHPDS